MFSVKEEEWKNLDTDYPIRHITKIGSVVEVSAVTFPAYEATQISARDAGAVEAARKALEDEALRVVRLTSSKWKPGEQHGKKVRTKYSLPIMFRLK